MNPFLRIAGAVLAAWSVVGAPVAGQVGSSAGSQRAVRGAKWRSERVELRDGRTCEGLIESEDDAWIHLIQVRRPRGRPMYLVIRPIERASVAGVVRLKPDERAELRRRIDRCIHRARIEAARRDAIRLGVLSKEGNHYHHYRGKWFTLDSSVDEPTTRRIIVRLEQIFTAYRQILAPRTESQRPLRLVILGSMEQHRTFLKQRGISVPSQACFLPDDNLIVAGSELARFSAVLGKLHARHRQLRAELDRREEQLSTELARMGRQLREQGVRADEIAKLLRIRKHNFQKEVEQKQKELNRYDRENTRKFDQVTQQMFVRLYHEAFHAYLENYVYPHRDYAVPRWLNEGLAMVCEAGLLESDTLRIDAPKASVLKRLQADLGGGGPLPLEQLLSGGQQDFVLGSGTSRYYVYSWGLAYYLSFEKHLLHNPALNEYVQQTSKETSPIERFEKLVGMPMAEFEQSWREYILKLR